MPSFSKSLPVILLVGASALAGPIARDQSAAYIEHCIINGQDCFPYLKELDPNSEFCLSDLSRDATVDRLTECQKYVNGVAFGGPGAQSQSGVTVGVDGSSSQPGLTVGGSGARGPAVTVGGSAAPSQPGVVTFGGPGAQSQPGVIVGGSSAQSQPGVTVGGSVAPSQPGVVTFGGPGAQNQPGVTVGGPGASQPSFDGKVGGPGQSEVTVGGSGASIPGFSQQPPARCINDDCLASPNWWSNVDTPTSLPAGNSQPLSSSLKSLLDPNMNVELGTQSDPVSLSLGGDNSGSDPHDLVSDLGLNGDSGHVDASMQSGNSNGSGTPVVIGQSIAPNAALGSSDGVTPEVGANNDSTPKIGITPKISSNNGVPQTTEGSGDPDCGCEEGL